jgi:hypothetical protein
VVELAERYSTAKPVIGLPATAYVTVLPAMFVISEEAAAEIRAGGSPASPTTPECGPAPGRSQARSPRLIRRANDLGDVSIAHLLPNAPRLSNGAFCGGFAPHKRLIRYPPRT